MSGHLAERLRRWRFSPQFRIHWSSFHPDRYQGIRSIHAEDHNFHFFSHAYLAATMKERLCYDDLQAKAMSGYVGARYEWNGSGGLRENSGNAALKDVLMNAEGTQYGVDLMNNPEHELPGFCEGPPLEYRKFGGGDKDLYRRTRSGYVDPS